MKISLHSDAIIISVILQVKVNPQRLLFPYFCVSHAQSMNRVGVDFVLPLSQEEQAQEQELLSKFIRRECIRSFEFGTKATHGILDEIRGVRVRRGFLFEGAYRGTAITKKVYHN